MNTPEVRPNNLAKTEEKPPLPAKSVSTVTATWKVPHVLKAISQDESGFTHREVREGGDRQVELTSETEFSEQETDEQVFSIKATNQLNFAGSTIDVLNDEVVLKDFRLVPTSPTASEYLSKVGTKVLIRFSCRIENLHTKQQKKSIYQIDRVFITLP